MIKQFIPGQNLAFLRGRVEYHTANTQHRSRSQVRLAQKPSASNFLTSSPLCPWNSNFLGNMKAALLNSRNLCLSKRESKLLMVLFMSSIPPCRLLRIHSCPETWVLRARAMLLWNPKSIHCERKRIGTWNSFHDNVAKNIYHNVLYLNTM